MRLSIFLSALAVCWGSQSLQPLKSRSEGHAQQSCDDEVLCEAQQLKTELLQTNVKLQRSEEIPGTLHDLQTETFQALNTYVL